MSQATMNDLSAHQLMLREHMRDFPIQLSRELVDATRETAVILNSGDFILSRKPATDLFYENMPAPNYNGSDIILLSTPNARFAYDSWTGKEIANTMHRHGFTDRTKLFPRWNSMLKVDALTNERLERAGITA